MLMVILIESGIRVDTKLAIQAYSIRELVGHSPLE